MVRRSTEDLRYMAHYAQFKRKFSLSLVNNNNLMSHSVILIVWYRDNLSNHKKRT